MRTPWGTGGRGWRVEQKAQESCPPREQNPLSVRREKKVYSHSKGWAKPLKRGRGAFPKAAVIFLKGQSMCSAFLLARPTQSQSTPRNPFPLCPTWQFQEPTGWGSWPIFWPSNNVIKNKNMLANKNLRLVFLRIYKDGVYRCWTLSAMKLQNKKGESEMQTNYGLFHWEIQVGPCNSNL